MAEWCHPCKKIGPVFESFAKSNEKEGVKFFECDVDEAEEIANEYEVETMPYFLVFKDGKKKENFMGTKEDKVT